MQEVEFSFFTLPDSGAFLTHAPKRLSEAFALVYPFQKEVWPLVILTVIVVGPILYALVALPEKLRAKSRPLRSFHDITYIREITRDTSRLNLPVTADRSKPWLGDGLLSRCIWYTCHIFLRQCWCLWHVPRLSLTNLSLQRQTFRSTALRFDCFPSFCGCHPPTS